jgi:hypothetical protein
MCFVWWPRACARVDVQGALGLATSFGPARPDSAAALAAARRDVALLRNSLALRARPGLAPHFKPARPVSAPPVAAAAADAAAAAAAAAAADAAQRASAGTQTEALMAKAAEAQRRFGGAVLAARLRVVAPRRAPPPGGGDGAVDADDGHWTRAIRCGKPGPFPFPARFRPVSATHGLGGAGALSPPNDHTRWPGSASPPPRLSAHGVGWVGRL